MNLRLVIMMALAFALLASAPVRAAQPADLPDELTLPDDAIIEVLLNGAPVLLEVSAEAFGPPIINPDVAARLQLLATGQRGWLFGPVSVSGWSSAETIDFGAGPQTMAISWADRPVSARADGVIGVHNLPHQRITFQLAAPAAGERTQVFALERAGGKNNARVGTEVKVGKKRLMMVFVPKRAENLITAPTANFIATHLEGGFVPDSEGAAIMDFAVERPIRTMRIARPLELGELLIETFAVRVEDYGDPKRVGEIGENDPRFQKGQILVSRRKGRGRPDLLTRIGRDQIAHCSRLTYDFERREIRLSCTDQQE